MHRANSRKGFTLIEALASVALIAIGVTATLSGLSSISKAQVRSLETEQMQRLAFRKYDEIVSQGLLSSGQLSGDFMELNDPRFEWQAQKISTGIGNLDTITVFVGRKGENFSHSTEVQGLLCRQSSGGGN